MSEWVKYLVDVVQVSKDAAEKALKTRVDLWKSNGKIGPCCLTPDDIFYFSGEKSADFDPLKIF